MAVPTPARLLHPTNDLAPRALLPGDPGRALALATAVMDGPLMFNHARGLWGYTGTAADGDPLTIQATGVGGPSAAAVVAELGALGLECAIRIGTCRSDALPSGTLLAAGSVLPLDGTSRALGATRALAPDAGLLAGLDGVAVEAVASVDLWDVPVPAGAVAVDLQTAAVLAACSRAGIRAAALLAVVDGSEDEDAREAIALALGRTAVTALGIPAVPAGAA